MKRIKFSGLVLAAFLAACGGGGSSTVSGAVNIQQDLPTETINSFSSTVTINRTGLFNIDMTAVSDTVTVAGACTVAEMLITGSSNTVTVQPGSTMQTLTVKGSSNTVYLPIGYVVAITNTGQSNNIIYR